MLNIGIYGGSFDPVHSGHVNLVRECLEKTLLDMVYIVLKGEQITQLAVYDYANARVADRLGVDILCVSDTGSMVL